jgi:hypothetical protein
VTGHPSFDYCSLIHALDERREEAGLTWGQLAYELHGQSADLNAVLMDHGICGGALIRQSSRNSASCQYALTLLRWLNRPPEDFLIGPVVDVGKTNLPEIGPEARLRWLLPETYIDLDTRRCEHNLTWAALGRQLDCSPGRLTNLKTARSADMDLAMRVAQWLGRSAATYLHAADW